MEQKSSTIKTPFGDAICKPKRGETSSGGSDKAEPTKVTPGNEKEQYHTKKA